MEVIAKWLYDMGYKGIAFTIIILLMFIEFNPKVKFNPISSFISWIGRKFNSSVDNQVSQFKKDTTDKLNSLDAKNQEQDKNLQEVSTDLKMFKLSSLYNEITSFEASILNGEKFYREQYRRELDNEELYNNLAKELDLSREQARVAEVEESIDTIRQHYKETRNSSEMMI